jgi:hypothetical protein
LVAVTVNVYEGTIAESPVNGMLVAVVVEVVVFVVVVSVPLTYEVVVAVIVTA